MSAGPTDADRRELTSLQRRAYGPDADLDPPAAARLRELEDLLATADADALPDAAATADVEPLPALDDQPPAPATRPAWRHPVVLGVGAVLGAGVLFAAGFVLAQVPSESDAGSLRPVTREEARADVVRGTASFQIRDLDPESVVQYEPLGQGTPWSATDAAGERCLILTVTDDSPEMIAAAGVWDVECAPAGLDPILDWEVDRAFPSPPQDLPDGSVVRLTLLGDRVALSVGRAG